MLFNKFVICVGYMISPHLGVNDFCLIKPSDQTFHGKNKLHFDKMIRSALYKTTTLSWVFIVLAH
jgi:hypothetical protein